MTLPAEEPALPTRPEVLTNLFQLRDAAEHERTNAYPFRIIADVIDADAASDVLLLRDASGVEFVEVEFGGRDIAPGSTVCLEGRGNTVRPKSFGLSFFPGMVVENDGIHPVTVQSGKVFLPAGTNAIAVQWFNGSGELDLKVEYEGPGIQRQGIPDSVLSRTNVDRATGRASCAAGLDFRCYEGRSWSALPDFRKYQPKKTGVAGNFDLNVRTRDQYVGLEFSGFIAIPRGGVYTFHLASDDGSRLFVGGVPVSVSVLSNGAALRAAEIIIPSSDLGRDDRPWVALEGTVNSVGAWANGGELQMRVGNADVRVDILKVGNSEPCIPQNGEIRVSGIYQNVLAVDGSRVPGRLLISSWKAIHPVVMSNTLPVTKSDDRETPHIPAAGEARVGAPPAISTVAEIKALSYDQARQELPVAIRGVATAYMSKYAGAVIQDSTRGVFVDLRDLPQAEPLCRGDFCQIEGITGPGMFAPVIVARRFTRLGPGQLPKPLRATWEQLVNGSLDTEYAEIGGIVTAVRDCQIELLTQGGKIALELTDFRPALLTSYEGALVEIRGCVFANYDPETHKLRGGSLFINGASVVVLQPAPRDLFDAPHRSVGELLFYDPKPAPFRLLKVSGQITYCSPGECFLSDGTNGMRLRTRNSESYAVGDLVDAVGFLKVGGPAVEFVEATLRKTGSAPLPPPTKLASDKLLQASHAGMRVQVNATLMSQWRESTKLVLELQSGFLAFKARLNGGGEAVKLPPFGSRLELTGAYAPQGFRVGDGTVSGFELLLHSPAGVRVLATPPWWTLKHLLVLAGILAMLLCVVLIWNKELRRQVQERTRKWETEIRNRQRAELQQAAEAERARIARDLHDELGTSLTEVSLLASAGLGQFQDGEKIRDRFHAIAEKARDLVSGLDVIVWAIDPKRNSLQSFADYLAVYANELFSHSSIVCRLRIKMECGAVALTESARHSLFLAVKESLNNVIRHAAATEVELRISQLGDRLHIVIADNGRGFDRNTIRRGNGLTNLQERLQTMQGECHVESQPGSGTTVEFIVPLPPAVGIASYA